MAFGASWVEGEGVTVAASVLGLAVADCRVSWPALMDAQLGTSVELRVGSFWWRGAYLYTS